MSAPKNVDGLLRVGVLFGGRSAEHEISILSARNVIAALDRTRFVPVPIGIDRDGTWRIESEKRLEGLLADPRHVHLDTSAPVVTLEPHPRGGKLVAREPAHASLFGSIDVVFPVLHGPGGEDGTVQGLLDLADLPYVGAGLLGSAIGMDKDVTKRLLRDAGIPVARFVGLRKSDFERDPETAAEKAAALGFPCFTKPANLGSSVGVRRVPSRAELHEALAYAFDFDTKVIVEEAVVGREIECSVLGNDEPIASGVGEIVVEHPAGFYSYDAKYVDEAGARLVIPAELSAPVLANVRETAVRVFRVLECAGLARVDFFLREDGTLLVNEINTLPGFTRISMYPKLWEVAGIGRTELVSRLIDLAIERHRTKTNLVHAR